MAVSKLFTPVLRARQPTAIQAEETAPMFMNPPTHAEIPVFAGPTDEGRPHYPLSLGGEKQASMKPNTVREISTAPQEEQNY